MTQDNIISLAEYLARKAQQTPGTERPSNPDHPRRDGRPAGTGTLTVIPFPAPGPHPPAA